MDFIDHRRDEFSSPEDYDIVELWEEGGGVKKRVESSSILRDVGGTDALVKHLCNLAKKAPNGMFYATAPFSSSLSFFISYLTGNLHPRTFMACSIYQAEEDHLFIVGISNRDLGPPSNETLRSLRAGELAKALSGAADEDPELPSFCAVTESSPHSSPRDIPYNPPPPSVRSKPTKRAGEIAFEELKGMRRLNSGTYSNVFLSTYRGEEVVVKMIRTKYEQTDRVEIALLQQTKHAGLIRMIGFGRDPRMFIVLEYLREGTLCQMLSRNQEQSTIGRVFFPKHTFAWGELIARAIELAEVLHYLHVDCIPGATVIHRDLKPDNVGFIDGKLVLFDLGLSTAVNRNSSSDETYMMSGFTGTLRYMAPEVLQNKAYSEKADVYSFSILLWQMATDRMPYSHIKDKQTFVKLLLESKERPKLVAAWPRQFQDLLKLCWHEEQHKRPTMEMVVAELRRIQHLSYSFSASR